MLRTRANQEVEYGWKKFTPGEVRVLSRASGVLREYANSSSKLLEMLHSLYFYDSLEYDSIRWSIQLREEVFYLLITRKSYRRRIIFDKLITWKSADVPDDNLATIYLSTTKSDWQALCCFQYYETVANYWRLWFRNHNAQHLPNSKMCRFTLNWSMFASSDLSVIAFKVTANELMIPKLQP